MASLISNEFSNKNTFGVSEILFHMKENSADNTTVKKLLISGGPINPDKIVNLLL